MSTPSWITNSHTKQISCLVFLPSVTFGGVVWSGFRRFVGIGELLLQFGFLPGTRTQQAVYTDMKFAFTGIINSSHGTTAVALGVRSFDVLIVAHLAISVFWQTNWHNHRSLYRFMGLPLLVPLISMQPTIIHINSLRRLWFVNPWSRDLNFSWNLIWNLKFRLNLVEFQMWLKIFGSGGRTPRRVPWTLVADQDNTL